MLVRSARWERMKDMSASTTVRRLQLGRELRRLREDAGVAREAVAAELECDLSKVSRLENGKLALNAAEIRALLALYDVEGDEAERVQRMAREARKRTVVRVPDWARTYLGLEADAAEIKKFEIELVPGLLQTEAYTRAVARAADPTKNPAEIERLVETRKERQSRLTDDDAPLLWVVMGEAVIHRPVGGPAAMAEQLARLVEVARHPKVSLQVLPFARGAHAAMGSSFTILRLSDPADVQIVYLEDLWSADYVDKLDRVGAYAGTFDRLCSEALDTEATIELMTATIERLARTNGKEPS